MRSERRRLGLSLLGLSLATLVVASASQVACESRDCAFDATCLVTTDAGADGPPSIVYPAGCDPNADAKDSPACVDDSVGVFVSPTGVDGRAGTKAEPLKTMAGALSVVGRNRVRVYICGTEPLAGPIRVSGASLTGIYAGFDCATWRHVGARVKIAVAPGFGDPALEIRDATFPVAIQDVELVGPIVGAPNNVGARVVGPSTRVTFSRVVLVAGDGADGEGGAQGAFTFPDGSLLRGGVSLDDKGGAPGGTTSGIACQSGGPPTRGGAGGNDGADGLRGDPDRGAGVGGTSAACTSASTGGADGGNGPAGAPGKGASVLGKPSAGDWVPQPGDDGASGQTAQGGGGGGGSGGGGGGGGGAGGCGGAGGKGGKGGGASVALAVFGGAQVKLVASELRAGKAGRGGKGGLGQTGQIGGDAGDGKAPGCNGGAGGKGGDGAPGGGGAGGLSVCVLYSITKPELGADTKLTVGTAGAGGAAGDTGAGDGVAGQALETLDAR